MTEGRRLDRPRRVAPGTRRAWLVGTAALALGADVVGAYVGLPTLAYALALPAVVLAGAAGAVGFVVGGLLAAAWSGATSLSTVAHLLGDLVFVTLGLLGWNNRHVSGSTERWRRLLAGVATYLRIATIALLAGVGVTAVGLAAAGAVPVAAAVPILLVDRTPAVLGSVTIVLAAWRLGVAGPDHDGRPTGEPAPTWLPGASTAAVAVLLGWIAAAVALGLVRQDVTALHGARAEFVAALPTTVSQAVLPVIGPYYLPVQAAAAVLAVATVATMLVGGPARVARSLHW